MKAIAILLFAALGLFTSGCTTLTTPPKTEIVDIDKVLNEVKDELNAYLNSKSSIPTPAADICFEGKSVELLPTKVTLTLTTAQIDSSNQTIGVVAPLGVFLIDPAISASQSSSRTQTLVIPLEILKGGEKRPVADKKYLLSDSIKQFRDALLKVNHSNTPCLKANKDTKITLTLAFNVVKSGSAGIGLSLAGFKLGDTKTKSSDATQILELEFEFTGGVLFSQQPG